MTTKKQLSLDNSYQRKQNQTQEILLGKLSRRYILSRLQYYGFIECGHALAFLHFVCHEEKLDKHAYRFLYGKISECLKNNDSGIYENADCEEYFKDLRVLQEELEFVISIHY